MGLRATAESDLAYILENPLDFGWPVVLTDPAGQSKSLYGSSTDVATLIDPDTGLAISGRVASVALRLSSIFSDDPGPALAIPEGITSETSKPWTVAFDDINGNSYTFKVSKTNPDRALGIITCEIETYEPLGG